MSKYISPELLKKAKEIDLLTYLKNYEPDELIKESRTQYCTKTHDSLKISNGYWNWCSVGIGGKNAIDYLEKVRGIKFPRSAEIVLEKMRLKTPEKHKEHENNKSTSIILPERNYNENIVIDYLKRRGIDKEIIKKCIEKKLIYEEKHYHNIVFCGYDETGNIKYAGCRATNESKFKSDATGSNKNYSFRLESNQKTDIIFIFEGAIDLLSYATLFKLHGLNWEDKTLISLAGVYQPARVIKESKVPITIQKYLEKHQEIKRIVLCLDNDIAGKNATNALKVVLSDKYEVIAKPPKKCKDYNEYLCDFLTEKMKKSKKLIKEI